MRGMCACVRFTIVAWLISRLLILGIVAAASPHGIAAANNWDGAWYQSIAEHGYGYARLGSQSDVAFFPLFPLVMRAIVTLGVPWTLAAVAFNNLCFFAALLTIYHLAARRWSALEARWCVAFACAEPMSLFASVVYPEALFLALTAVALAALERNRLTAVLAAAAAGAASAIGIALSLALVARAIAARDTRALVLALLSFAGLAGFALFCALRFSDPLAFVHAQHAWRSGLGFNAGAWNNLIASLTSAGGFRLNVMTIVLVPVAAIAAIVQRKTLGPLMTWYALIAIALLLLSGEPISADRKAAGVIPILMALGRPLARLPYAGVAIVLALATLLALDSWSFARFLWVG